MIPESVFGSTATAPAGPRAVEEDEGPELRPESALEPYENIVETTLNGQKPQDNMLDETRRRSASQGPGDTDPDTTNVSDADWTGPQSPESSLPAKSLFGSWGRTMRSLVGAHSGSNGSGGPDERDFDHDGKQLMPGTFASEDPTPTPTPSEANMPMGESEGISEPSDALQLPAQKIPTSPAPA